MLKSRKSADQWFDEYGFCHQNHTNKTIHWICIPLILLSIIGLLWEVPVPGLIARAIPQFNWAWFLLVASLIFYLRISVTLAIGMALVTGGLAAIVVFYQRANLPSVTAASAVLFVLAWIGQFAGHKIEGRKPAFFDDLKFLLIGPLWLLGFIYRRLGIRY